MNNSNEKGSRSNKRSYLLSVLFSVMCLLIAVALIASTILVATFNNKVDPNYAQVYERIKDYKRLNGFYSDGALGIFEIFPKSSDAVQESSDGASDTLKNYSGTNLQVQGIDEADIIKTDGEYIYVICSQNLYIIQAVEGQMKVVSKTARAICEEDGFTQETTIELFLVGDRLILLKHCFERNTAEPAYYWIYSNDCFTVAESYDVSDKSQPGKLGSVGQKGYYSTSRMVGDRLYLVTNMCVLDARANDPSTFVPQTVNNGEKEVVAPQDICLPSIAQGNCFCVISAIDTAKNEIISTKSILNGGGTVYMSHNNLYLATNVYKLNEKSEESYNATTITRVALNDGMIEIAASGEVKGSLINQFAMDEYDGNLRVVTTCYANSTVRDSAGVITDWNSATTNNLYVLNAGMEVVGAIEGLAEDERVYSVRFSGEIGYFVTFRQTDPLFSVDLSDASNPKILGALKINGFSEYLHPFGENLLFGLGKDADDQGRVGFLKLSMFDTTDKTDVKEISKLVLDGVYYSEASYNHKAIMVDYARNLIALPTDNCYMIFRYDEGKGFTKIAQMALSDSNYSYWNNLRGLYIDDYFYAVGNCGAISLDLNSGKTVAEITLDEFHDYYKICVD